MPSSSIFSGRSIDKVSYASCFAEEDLAKAGLGGSAKLSKLREDITETLEVILRQWKVIHMVHQKFSCLECEKIMQPPAPSHVAPRGLAGPDLPFLF